LLVSLVLVVPVAAALGAKVQVGPVKGGFYSGTLHHEEIVLEVAKNGKSVRVSLPVAPAYCQGGSSAEEQKTQASAISGSGRFTTRIAYFVRHTSKQFATVTISGSFYGRVFQGTAKSSFTPAKSCNGQESFEAKAG
jgi:hypothetical protein